MIEKQEHELFWVNQLKELLAGFPQGDIQPNQSDPPDVLVKAADQILGIEVMRLFRPSVPREQLLQAREGNTRRIVESARLLHIQAGLPPVRVSIQFNRNLIQSKEVSPLATAVAEIVRRNLPAEGEASEEEYNWVNRSYFPDKIDQVSIYRTVPDDTWVATEAAWSPRCGPDYLRQEINKKTPKYAEAKNKSDQTWLLLVTNAQGLASHVHLSDSAFAQAYATPYERVFVIASFSKVYELQRKMPTYMVAPNADDYEFVEQRAPAPTKPGLPGS